MFADSGDNFSGEAAGTFPAGRYEWNDLKAYHIDTRGYPGNPSSMKVPAGLTIILFNGYFFDLAQTVVAGPRSVDFANDSAYTDWNKQVGSFIILKSATFEISGTWEAIGSNSGPLDKLVKVGLSHS